MRSRRPAGRVAPTRLSNGEAGLADRHITSFCESSTASRTTAAACRARTRANDIIGSDPCVPARHRSRGSSTALTICRLQLPATARKPASNHPPDPTASSVPETRWAAGPPRASTAAPSKENPRQSPAGGLQSKDSSGLRSYAERGAASGSCSDPSPRRRQPAWQSPSAPGGRNHPSASGRGASR